MGQIIHPKHGVVERIYHGNTEIVKVYRGNALVWSKDAAGWPEITSFTVRKKPGGGVTFSFAVARSTHNVITLDGRNVPLTSDTGARAEDGGVGHHVAILTASNAAGAVSRRVEYDWYQRGEITNFRVQYVTPAGVLGQVNAYFSADWKGWPKPTFTIDYGAPAGFVSVNARHVSGTVAGTISGVVHTYVPGTSTTARLRGVNLSERGLTNTVIVTVQVRT